MKTSIHKQTDIKTTEKSAEITKTFSITVLKEGGEELKFNLSEEEALNLYEGLGKALGKGPKVPIYRSNEPFRSKENIQHPPLPFKPQVGDPMPLDPYPRVWCGTIE